MRSEILPQSGLPDAFLSHCFWQPLQYSESHAFWHWVSSPWFCFRPLQQPSCTTPLNGSGTDGFARFSVFTLASFFNDFFTLSERLSIPRDVIASSSEKPYFNAHSATVFLRTSSIILNKPPFKLANIIIN
jgi:hypothetical protein